MGAVKSRTVSYACATRSRIARRELLALVQTDLMTISKSFSGLGDMAEVPITSSRDLGRADEVDAAAVTALAGIVITNEQKVVCVCSFRVLCRMLIARCRY